MTGPESPRVVAIVLNWNGWRDTTECVRSLARLEGITCEVLIVDNGSTDDSVEQLRQECPGVRLLETHQNLGFAGGINRGVTVALSEGADFVWLLNNDLTVAPESLSALVSAMQRQPDVGLACPKILHAARPDAIWFAGGTYLTPQGYVVHHGEGERDSGQHDHALDLEFACGCSILARRKAVEEIGLIPEEYFLYWEDVAWSAMARAAGWRITLVPESRVWHNVGASLPAHSRPLQRLRERYEMRNRIMFHRRHCPERLWGILWRSAANIAMMAKSRTWIGCAIAHGRGMADALLRRTGPIRGHSHR